MKLPPIMTADGRRAWAFIAIWGGCITFTAFAGVALYWLRNSDGFTFWLALAAHVQILVGMTALGWALGRRAKIIVTKDGAEIHDGDGE